jgi:hypothetical protein
MSYNTQSLTTAGAYFAEHKRYIHSMKTGMFLCQFQYKCSNVACKKKVVYALDVLNHPSTPDHIKFSYPFTVDSAHSLILFEDVTYLITGDAITAKTFDEIVLSIGEARMTEYLRRRAIFKSSQDFFSKRRRHGSEAGTAAEVERALEDFSTFDDPNGYNETKAPAKSTVLKLFRGVLNPKYSHITTFDLMANVYIL